MTELHRIYLDTNILIAMSEEMDERGEALRRMAIAHSPKRKAMFLTSEITLAELLVKPYRDGNRPLADIYTRMMQGEHWIETLAVTVEILDMAATLRSVRGATKLPDAIHIATAMHAGCSHLMTGDTGITDFEPIAHPFRPITLPPLSVIRPDVPTLTSILNELAP